MAYHIYQTEGFVIGRRNIKEADALLEIFTLDFGLLSVQAKSIRILNSKMRFHSTCPGHLTLSLVKGGGPWRLISAEKTKLLEPIMADSDKRQLVARIFNLLVRLMNGEEANKNLFNTIKNSFVFMSEVNSKDLSYRSVECIIVLRILKSLGYLGDGPILEPFVISDSWDYQLVKAMTPRESEAIRAINNSFITASL